MVNMDDQLQLISASSFKFSCKNVSLNVRKDDDWFCGFMKKKQGLVLLDNNRLNLGLNWENVSQEGREENVVWSFRDIVRQYSHSCKMSQATSNSLRYASPSLYSYAS